MNTANFLILVGFVVSAHATSYARPPRCLKPPAVGRCKAKVPRWYYDPSSNKCKLFIYGGCEGNNNRFQYEVGCLKTCLPGVPTKPVCSLHPPKRTCKAGVHTWSFDWQAGGCRFFLHGDCNKNDNRFKTCLDCMNRCSGTKPKNAQRICEKLTVEVIKKYGDVLRPILGGRE
uniref:BPTI/Kunitz inhibitor domain-containing protein n=1 Tax=Amblyomma americanum TaxID=6943 RepID=A0A0C9R5S4_AMBAM